MFHSIFITTQNGVCIFEKHFIKIKTDSQLISGFINAMGSFAIEALGSGMQSLRLQTGEQMFVYPFKKTSLIGMAITDAKDDPDLVQKLLLEILMEFSAIFYQKLEQDSTNIQEFEEFKYTIDVILEGKISSRTTLKMFLGVIAGWILMGVMTLTLIPIVIGISTGDITQFGFGPINFADQLQVDEIQTLQIIAIVIVGVLMIYFCIIYLLPAFLAAYIAGDRRRGIWTALLFGASIFLILLGGTLINEQVAVISPVIWFLVFSPFLITLSIICGFYGGRLKEKKKLYPLEQ